MKGGAGNPRAQGSAGKVCCSFFNEYVGLFLPIDGALCMGSGSLE